MGLSWRPSLQGWVPSHSSPSLPPPLPPLQRGAFSGAQLAALASGMGALASAAAAVAPAEWKRDLLTALQVWRCGSEGVKCECKCGLEDGCAEWKQDLLLVLRVCGGVDWKGQCVNICGFAVWPGGPRPWALPLTPPPHCSPTHLPPPPASLSPLGRPNSPERARITFRAAPTPLTTNLPPP